MRNDKDLSLADIPLPGTELLERQIIADAVENPDAIGEVSSVILPEFFTSDDRKMIWNTIVGMYNARETIDMPSVWQRTGRAYIDEIQTAGVIPSTYSGLLDHSRLLQVANTKKRAYYAALTILQQSASVGSSEDDIFSAADELSRKIKGDGRDIGETPLNRVIESVAEETEADEEEARQGRSVRITTSIPSLDRNLWGGWGKGQLIILAARPSVGKTALMLQFAKASAESGNPTLVFSMEMTKPELGRRLLFSTELVSQEEMMGKNVNWDGFNRAQGAIEKLPIYINDEARTLQGIISRITVAVNQGRCSIAMIDYLGQMHFEPSSRVSLSQQIGFATTELKQAAKRLGIPIVLLVQLNRNSVNDGRPPELHDLRDSGSIEQDADVVLMLEQEFSSAEAKREGETPKVHIWLRKNRNYKKDIRITTIPNESYTHFTEKADERYFQPVTASSSAVRDDSPDERPDDPYYTNF